MITADTITDEQLGEIDCPPLCFDCDGGGCGCCRDTGADLSRCAEILNARARASRDETESECIYCAGHHGPSGTVPDLHDDAAWSALAAMAPTCEWVATRAHRQEPNERARDGR